MVINQNSSQFQIPANIQREEPVAAQWPGAFHGEPTHLNDVIQVFSVTTSDSSHLDTGTLKYQRSKWLRLKERTIFKFYAINADISLDKACNLG
jgi:hypothetical protein